MELISPFSADSLDIELIKDNLKQTLIDNDTITDINYEGSNISTLVQILSYIEYTINATHAMNSNQTNLKLSEIRQNIIHEAQTRGYNITRKVSSKMNITLTLDITSAPLTIPKWTKFLCGDYIFYNTSEILFTTESLFKTVDIVEGVYVDYNIDSDLRYVSTETAQNLKLSYKNIEDENIYYRIKKSGEEDFSDYYTKVDTLIDIVDNEINLFEEYDPETEFATIWTSFANQGNLIESGDTVDIQFLISNGSLANGIIVCELESPIDGLTINVNSQSRGGSDEESNDSIKANAPLFFNTGLRTVSDPDYEAYLIKNSLIENVSAWGGETMLPIELGHTYLSIIPQDENFKYLTSLEETSVLSYLNQKSMIATGRKFKHPNYISFDIDIQVVGTVPNIEEKKVLINEKVTEYFDENHNTFKTYIFQSKIVRIIENIFLNNTSASINVVITPKLRLSNELFSQTFTNGRWDIYIPNSPRKYRLVKNGDIIEIPENETDLYSYIINGWTKEITPDEDITISFNGNINSKVITFPETLTQVDIDGTLYDKRTLLLDAVEIGYFIPDLNILSLEDISAELVQDEFLNVVFSPNINIKSEKATVIELGSITYS
jgi:hypothetical protein